MKTSRGRPGGIGARISSVIVPGRLTHLRRPQNRPEFSAIGTTGTHNGCERGVPRLERFVGGDQAPPDRVCVGTAEANDADAAAAALRDQVGVVGAAAVALGRDGFAR